MTDEKKPQQPPELPPTAFSWEAAPPLYAASGFVMNAGNVYVFFTYYVYPQGVLLVATTRIGDQAMHLWRRHWASYEAAARSAESLVGEAEEYLTETLHLRIRESEDLGADDFIQHLSARINNELH